MAENPVYSLLSLLVTSGTKAVKETAKDGLRQAAGEIVQALGVSIASPKRPEDSDPNPHVDKQPKR